MLLFSSGLIDHVNAYSAEPTFTFKKKTSYDILALCLDFDV